MCDRGLDSDSNQAVCIVERYPGVADKLPCNTVSTSAVPSIQVRAMPDEEPHHIRPSLVRGAMQGRAPVAVNGVHVGAEFEEEFYCFQVFFYSPFVCHTFHPADT